MGDNTSNGQQLSTPRFILPRFTQANQHATRHPGGGNGSPGAMMFSATPPKKKNSRVSSTSADNDLLGLHIWPAPSPLGNYSTIHYPPPPPLGALSTGLPLVFSHSMAPSASSLQDKSNAAPPAAKNNSRRGKEPRDPLKTVPRLSAALAEALKEKEQLQNELQEAKTREVHYKKYKLKYYEQKEKKKKVNMIPRPPGERGKDGWSLIQNMRLSEDKPTYNALMRGVRMVAAEVGINEHVRFNQQDHGRMHQLYELSRNRFPYLANFENDWATKEFVKQVLTDRRKHNNRIVKQQKKDAGPQASETAGAPTHASPSSDQALEVTPLPSASIDPTSAAPTSVAPTSGTTTVPGNIAPATNVVASTPAPTMATAPSPNVTAQVASGRPRPRLKEKTQAQAPASIATSHHTAPVAGPSTGAQTASGLEEDRGNGM